MKNYAMGIDLADGRDSTVVDISKLVEDAVRAGATYGSKRGRPGPFCETYEEGLLKVIEQVQERWSTKPPLDPKTGKPFHPFH